MINSEENLNSNLHLKINYEYKKGHHLQFPIEINYSDIISNWMKFSKELTYSSDVYNETGSA